MIRPYIECDLEKCAKLLMDTYNCPPWDCHWTDGTACRYLREYADSERFVGLLLWNEDELIGAAFCHEKTWWTNDELFVDEFFIAPAHQGKGNGKALLLALEEHIRSNRLAGFTLLTNKYLPAPGFYRHNGFSDADHVLYMYKVL